MGYGTDPAATPDQLQQQLQQQPRQHGYGKDPLWQGLKTAKADETKEQPGVGASLWDGLKAAREGLEHGGQEFMQGMAGRALKLPTMLPGAEAGRQRMIADLAQRQQQGQQAFAQNPAVQRNPMTAGVGRMAGNMIGAAPAMAIPGASGAGMGLAARTAMGGGLGALTGGMPGAAAGAGMGALGGMIGPRLSPAAQAIATNPKLQNLWAMATGAMGRTAESFQRATANEVLQPLGQMVGRTVKVGHDLVNEVGDRISDAYNRVLPKMTFRATEPNPETGKTFVDSIPALAENVPEAHAKDFERIVKRQISNRVDEAGNMSGEEFKRADHEIGRQAARFSTSPDANQQEYGDVLRDLQAGMRDALAIHNPAEAPALRQADAAWARYVRMQEAAGRRVDANGEFMPNDLLMAVRSTTKGSRNRIFAGGDGPLQAFGRAGNDLISGQQPKFDKYLADLMGAGIGGAAGHAIGGPMGGYLGAGAGAAAAHGAQSALSPVARGMQTPQARVIGEAVGRAAPEAGAIADHVSPIGP